MPNIENWVKRKIAQGFNEKEIVGYMLQHGYTKDQIQTIFQTFPPKPTNNKLPSLTDKPKGIGKGKLLLIMSLILVLGIVGFLVYAEIQTGLVSGLFS